ncbi:2-dehydro-3-deoxygalactonokinase [Acidovorax sp. BL-A-41-H1]|uniref:2-dehydro-3-deoxygalactonokinase n=1 Tax=Acidovorax sp. BL-A-41-H1 TaxID=3421102 RepID=UPI003F7A7963
MRPPDTTAPPASRLVALDWGTSSLRASHLDAAGCVLDERERPWGIMNLPSGHGDGAQPDSAAAFERALEGICGDWLAADPPPALLACGMVGSAQGWREARYLDTPASPGALAQGLTRVDRPRGPALHIVPGLLQCGALPNVMRGEETQVLGALAGLEWTGNAQALVGLPGTHSKWVVAHRHGIARFHTFMTGEVFAALREHTILGRTMAAAAEPDDAAFLRGLEVARQGDAGPGLLSQIFTVRTLGLTNALAAGAQADYLSGLLIGHEMVGLARAEHEAFSSACSLVLCGTPGLCRRYAMALDFFGLGTPSIAAQPAVTGLWRVAVAAGLLASPGRQADEPLGSSWSATA